MVTKKIGKHENVFEKKSKSWKLTKIVTKNQKKT